MAKPVTRRALLVALIVSCLLSAVGGAVGGAALASHGWPKRAYTDQDAVTAVEDNSQEVARSIQDQLDPSPQEVASDLSDLCSTLEQTSALSNETLNCP